MGKLNDKTPQINNKLGQHLNNGSFALSCDEGVGLMCGIETPAYGFKDLVGDIIPRSGGGAAPSFTPFRGTRVKNYAFNSSDVVDNITFHMPHDYAPNTDMFIHVHWGHNGTAISGDLGINLYVMYSKGYNRGVFNQEFTLAVNLTGLSIATHPRWSHQITEVPLSVNGGGVNLLDTADLEVDGLIEVALSMTSIPSITGSDEDNLPYIKEIDIHYQSTELATKNKNYPFYT